jgi:hypothetical protein
MRLEGHLRQLDMWKDGKTPTVKDYDPDKDVVLHILKELAEMNGKLGGVAQAVEEIRKNMGGSGPG